jgi:hypothetical protein
MSRARGAPNPLIAGGARVRTVADASRFIERVGYCMLFPALGAALPSLYFAAAGRQHVTWDKYSVLIWDWKAELPRRRLAFYGKYFKGRGSFISLSQLPYFLAMRESVFGENDFEQCYAEGQISADACAIWKVLAEQGACATLGLRHAAKMETPAGNVRFKRAMLGLQRRLIVVHFGAEQETESWTSGKFNLTLRAFPMQMKQAREINCKDARAKIADKYLSIYPDAEAMQVARVFGWSKAEAMEAITPAGARR